MLDYPLQFPGSNMTVPWTRTGMSVAVVLVALTVLLLSCCGAAALFLVACCGSRRRDAVAESGDSRWLPGVGLIDYVPVSNRSSVRVSLIMSTGSQGPEQTPQGHHSPSADTASPPAATAASPSALPGLCSIQRPGPRARGEGGVRSAPASPARSRRPPEEEEEEMSSAVLASSVSSQALGRARSRSAVPPSGSVAGSGASLPSTLPPPVEAVPSSSPPPSSSSPSPAPASSSPTPSVRLKSRWSWSTVPSQRRPRSTDSSL